jgi:hypothetical protein
VWKVLYREKKLYGLARINGWNKNGDFELYGVYLILILERDKQQ